MEGVLAALAIAAVLLIGLSEAKELAPTLVFARGIGRMLSAIGIPAELGAHFGALAISTFLLLANHT